MTHAIESTGATDLKYLALSTKEPYDICECPDTDQIGVYVGDYGAMDLRA